jgi:hypothetical protein
MAEQVQRNRSALQGVTQRGSVTGEGSTVRLARMSAIAVAMAVLTCTPRGSPGEAGAPATSPPSTGSAVDETSGPVTMAQAKACPVTPPSPAGPSGPARDAFSRDAFFGWGASYGNGTLWVGGLWPQGIIAVGHGFVDDRGRVGMKFGWWTKVPGRLEITGRRLGGPAPPVRAVVPDGYGPGGFRPSGVIFPTEGCWEITGSIHRTELSFVTFVIKRNKGS